jgi:hypothetical protein
VFRVVVDGHALRLFLNKEWKVNDGPSISSLERARLMLYACASEAQFIALATFLIHQWRRLGEHTWVKAINPFLLGEHRFW